VSIQLFHRFRFRSYNLKYISRKKITFLAVILACLWQTNGMILDCSFKVSNYSVLENIYACDAKAIFLSENDDEIQFVFQNHLSGKKNSDVKGIY